MSPSIHFAPISMRCNIDSFDEFEKLSKIVTSLPFFINNFTKCLPIKPAPPVTNIFNIYQKWLRYIFIMIHFKFFLKIKILFFEFIIHES